MKITDTKENPERITFRQITDTDTEKTNLAINSVIWWERTVVLTQDQGGSCRGGNIVPNEVGEPPRMISNALRSSQRAHATAVYTQR